MLVAILKVGLLLIMAGAAVAIFWEIVPMARGKVLPGSKPGEREEQ